VTLVALVGVALFALLGRSAQSQTAAPALAARSSLSAATGGSKIAFIREAHGGYAGVLWVMNPDGSGQRRVGPAFPEMDWSPDGQKIAFATWSDRGRVPRGQSDIYVTNADGSGRQRLTSDPSFDSDPAWSPDGRTIAFLSGRDGNSGIYVMNADGSKQRLLTRVRGSASPSELVWSPNAQKIAFTIGRDGNSEIYVVNADGSGQQRLTRNTVRDDNPQNHNPVWSRGTNPVWSPDGRRIAFSSNWQLWVMNADGSGQRRLTRNGAHNFNPDWSPDGQRIAFERGKPQSDNCCPGASGFEVYVMNADGSGQQRLTRGGSQPRWSPDGRRIAFVSLRSGYSQEIYVMNADGSGQRNLTRTPGAGSRESSPVWSHAQKP
jgi:TolB protein